MSRNHLACWSLAMAAAPPAAIESLSRELFGRHLKYEHVMLCMQICLEIQRYNQAHLAVQIIVEQRVFFSR